MLQDVAFCSMGGTGQGLLRTCKIILQYVSDEVFRVKKNVVNQYMELGKTTSSY
jgi:hypothetical protein